jgi:hypothetical protein
MQFGQLLSVCGCRRVADEARFALRATCGFATG